MRVWIKSMKFGNHEALPVTSNIATALYRLIPLLYAKFLATRWQQLTDVHNTFTF